MTSTKAMNDHVGEAAAEQEAPSDRRHRGRAEVGADDHRFAPDRVEETSEGERAEQVADREDGNEEGHGARGDLEEVR